MSARGADTRRSISNRRSNDVAQGYPPLADDRLAQELDIRFTARVAAELRQRILERIEPDIKAAVAAGVASLKVDIQAYADLMRQRLVFQAIIDNVPGPVEELFHSRPSK
jgi:hypothetical protein